MSRKITCPNKRGPARWTFALPAVTAPAMTPAIMAAKKAKIPFSVHEYSHERDCRSYGLEAAEKLRLDPARIFKTLIADLGGELVVGIIPVTAMLSLKNIALAAGSKKAVMADKAAAERATGYVLGGISPLGQKKRLRTFIDDSAAKHATVLVSAGRRGLEIELCAQDLARLTNAAFAPLCGSP